MTLNKMLIDATHLEETRVVVLRNSKLDAFDFEFANRRQIRGNIYLAKVIRVESALQAAFVDYGGNRHGFLAFNEIHPDYFQIPVADRRALQAQQMKQAKDHKVEPVGLQIDDDEDIEFSPQRFRAYKAMNESDAGIDESNLSNSHTEPSAVESSQEFGPVQEYETSQNAEVPDRSLSGDLGLGEQQEEPKAYGAEPAPSQDVLEDYAPKYVVDINKYKIQEVIKKGQVILVQVMREERGNKGAALTTYLSLAGRYSVLMPNRDRGAGISRKITNVGDRERLREIVHDLETPSGMSMILRTAGASRSKTEIKRDFEYLMRLWEKVRTRTLESQAPTLVYEEGSLVKRSIRDLYTKDIDEIIVSGESAYQEAKTLMDVMFLSHSKVVKLYDDEIPIFTRYGIEQQLEVIFSTRVNLKSGGYLVINPTEALTSIDINSGRSIKEHHIEDTALRTNLEAAEEIARQVRLRDLAGLVVIDFIDMVDRQHIKSVEKKLLEGLKSDRAKIQVGKISMFGLLEMSRQRTRSGLLESSSIPCTSCQGTGFIRSPDSIALQILREIQTKLLTEQNATTFVVYTSQSVSTYLFNKKKKQLCTLEERHNVTITVLPDESFSNDPPFTISTMVEHELSAGESAFPAVSEQQKKRTKDEFQLADSSKRTGTHRNLRRSSHTGGQRLKTERSEQRTGGRQRRTSRAVSQATVTE